MLWFYGRDNERLEVETRFDNETLEYVLIIRWPDQRSVTERFPDAGTFQTRLSALEQDFGADRWQKAGAPILLADGWPDKRPPR